MQAPAQVRKDAQGSSLGLLTVLTTASFYQRRGPELGARELALAYSATLTTTTKKKSLERTPYLFLPIPPVLSSSEVHPR